MGFHEFSDFSNFLIFLRDLELGNGQFGQTILAKLPHFCSPSHFQAGVGLEMSPSTQQFAQKKEPFCC